MTLQYVEPTAHAPTLNILLYGPPGTGKTVAACSAPGPVLVVNAEGPGALSYARKLYGNEQIREVKLENAQTLDDVYLHVKEGGPEKTVVIDTVGESYRTLIEKIAGPRPSMQNYGDVNTKLDRFIRAMRDLSVNVVLVAHEQIDDEGGEITRRPATGGRKLPEQVMAQVDVVAYTGVVVETDDSPRRYIGQVIEANGRRAKDRSGSLGKVRDLNLTDWIATATKAMTPAGTNGKPKTQTRKAAA